jgi:hypothetical protein
MILFDSFINPCSTGNMVSGAQSCALCPAKRKLFDFAGLPRRKSILTAALGDALDNDSMDIKEPPGRTLFSFLPRYRDSFHNLPAPTL